MDAPATKPQDLDGRTILITGANTGIGYWCAESLAARGARVLLGCRSAERAATAVDAIRLHVPDADLGVVGLDLGSLDSVRRAAAEIGERLDAVICNAGVKSARRDAKTSDGLDLMMGTNFLGHFALVARLEPLLADDARVVAVGSLAHRFARIDPGELSRPWKGSSLRRYGRSKAALMAFVFELDRRWSGTGRSAVCAHPGYAVDPLTAPRPGSVEVSAALRRLAALSRPFVQGKDDGAAPVIHAATAAGVQSGDYWGPSGKLEFRGTPARVAVSAEVRSADTGAALWPAAEQLTGVRFPLDGMSDAPTTLGS
ncbi:MULTISPECIES: SDR family NAD(P)-dependent oxidoreductase [unclassified Microbacterium]|uniref:SDR family NAD(P)-dependent oxidoreductase n=1 Tax=unclassified Microbacterium TaxID=2609290 RepID=UPI000EA914E0|nr:MULTISPECIES: SDR family NAD(P)-dependent oxidoreductase [unclassified Microbacterium]MBT2484736.1 SDR family NAD(P)-dependent oxidoreductase [Microbacterium sp. ISL-108]RKN67618.1 SDR family NAD(P)-dependent oxidoreductase [Microbacterium sp. CGR2]